MLDFDMSPYGAFVWPAWAISVLVLGAVVARAVLSARRWKAELKRLETETGSAQGPVAENPAQAAQGAIAANNP